MKASLLVLKAAKKVTDKTQPLNKSLRNNQETEAGFKLLGLYKLRYENVSNLLHRLMFVDVKMLIGQWLLHPVENSLLADSQ
jgi:hypothetical protein